jgi:hypothetical protein
VSSSDGLGFEALGFKAWVFGKDPSPCESDILGPAILVVLAPGLGVCDAVFGFSPDALQTASKMAKDNNKTLDVL